MTNTLTISAFATAASIVAFVMWGPILTQVAAPTAGVVMMTAPVLA